MAEKKLIAGAGPLTCRLRLFVAGDEPNSGKARAFLARLCEQHLNGSHEVQIVDVLEDYQAALANQVIAVPTLIVETPTGRTVIVGSLSDPARVLDALGIHYGEERPT